LAKSKEKSNFNSEDVPLHRSIHLETNWTQRGQENINQSDWLGI